MMQLFTPRSAARRRLRLPLATLLVASALVITVTGAPQSAAAASLCATPPTTGTTTVSGVVNTYYRGQSPLLPAGQSNTTVTVGTAQGAATAVAVGDLALVIQMQGAAIDSTNSGAYGDGVAADPARGNLNDANFIAGRYEYVTVTSVVGNVIGIAGAGANGGLLNSYINADATATSGQFRFQVVRVPQYSSVTLGATSALPWNGTVGGLAALDVAATLNLNSSTINADAAGFRGGVQRIRRGSALAGLANTDYRTPTSVAANGQKGEGIAGTPVWKTGDPDTVGDGYPGGDFGRGAPGNAGGGGTDGRPTSNDQNSGGGGGGNAGVGGVGGNTWSSNLPRGGFGGATVTSAVDRAFLGGGGGAGSDNDGVLSSSGARGGGLVLVRAGRLIGTGTITANGAAGSISGQDGAGGGGAGGSVIVTTSSSGAASGLGGLTVTARGGAGGNETNGSPHGPGGGGGGGFVLTTELPAAASSVVGGTNGLHVPTNDAFGAGPGLIGTTVLGSIDGTPGTTAGSRCIDVSVTKTLTPTSFVPGTDVTYTVVVTNRGPHPVTGTTPITVNDPVPAAISSVSWTCAASVGSTCAATSGTGSPATIANLALNGSATYTITGRLAAAFTGPLTNTATATPPTGVTELTPADNTASATASATPRANLSITKTDGATVATPGTDVTYTIVVGNAGPSAVSNAPVIDALPAGALSGTWSCAPAAGASCASSGGAMPLSSTVSLIPGATATYTATIRVAPGATGSLVNTARVDAPAGVTELDATDNIATDTDTLTPRADLSITKTDGLTTVDAGTSLTYTIVATNSGPSTVSGATVTDTLPASLTGATWTCTASVGSSCPAAGTGNINASVDLASGGTATFTVTGTVSPAATGTVTNTATVTPPGSVPDPTPGNNAATDVTSITQRADLSITKTDGTPTAVAGSSVTYTIVARNSGPSAALGTTVTDNLPASLTGSTWTCVASAGSTCPAGGTGNISAAVDLAVGGAATFTLTANVSSAATGNIVNTATIQPAAGVIDPNPADNAATDTDTLVLQADLAITKTDGVTTQTPGATVTYTIVARNAGPSAVTGATVIDTLAPTLSAASWTCASTGGGSCPASGSGSIGAGVDLPVGATATFTLTATIDPSAVGNLTNAASITAPVGVTDPNTADNTATDVDTLTPSGDLSITKTDSTLTAVPGAAVRYTVAVTNAGPSDMRGASVVDTLPSSLIGAMWDCVGAGSATCASSNGTGDINTTVDLPVGATATFAITATVDATLTGSLANTATVGPAPGTLDPDGSNNSATDTDTLTPQADLTITKTDGRTSAVPGTATSYTIVVRNVGPSSVLNAPVTDALPAELTAASWTCIGASGGGCDTANGSGDINATVDLPPGGTATFTMSATIAAGATGTVSNTAAVDTPSGVTDTNTANNTATDTTVLAPQVDLTVTKTDGVITVNAGGTVTYTIVVTNDGPSAVTGATLMDALPAELRNATWTCSGTAGASCATTSGSGGLAIVVNMTSGSSISVTIDATVDPSARGTLSNTATVSTPSGVTDSNPADNSATDVDAVLAVADLSISKTDGRTGALPGDTLTYTIAVANAGPSAALGALVQDTIPAEVSGANWTCLATAGSSCTASSGSGDIAERVDLGPGGRVTFTVIAIVRPGATGTVVNTATVEAPSGVNDPNPANNAASDPTVLSPLADVSVTKTDGVSTVVAGAPTTYLIVVTNAGPSAISGVRVTDSLPAVLTNATWTCSPSGGATCGASNGIGSVDEIVDLPAASTLRYTVAATVDAGASGTITNTAAVTLPGGVVDPTPSNNTSTDTTTVSGVADLSIVKTNGSSTVVPGTRTNYTITARNDGPSNAFGARIVDLPPASLTGVAWSCSARGGAVCSSASGTGSVDLLVDVPVGGSISIDVGADVSAGASGQLANTATIAPSVGTTDPNLSDNQSTDTDTVTPMADISVTKTDGTDTVVPGTVTAYTVVVANAGPSPADGVSVVDLLPIGVSSATWTCTPTSGASCSAASGSGSISTTVNLPAGASVRFVVTASIAPGAAGSVVNTATASVPFGVDDPNPGDNGATDVDVIAGIGDLSITKIAGVERAQPTDVVTYTIVASNAGPSAVVGAGVSDVLPADLVGATWTCSATAGSSCATPTGTGSISTTVDLLPSGSATFVVRVTVGNDAIGTVTNTASVVPPVGVTDPDPSNNTGSDSIVVDPRVELAITKVADRPTAAVGDLLAYTIVTSNAGPSVAHDVTVADPVPAGLVAQTWTCTGSGGATCGESSGTGSPVVRVDIPARGSITIVLNTTVALGAPTDIVNVATVSSLATSSSATATADITVVPESSTPPPALTEQPRPGPTSPPAATTPTPSTPGTTPTAELPSTGSNLDRLLQTAGLLLSVGVGLWLVVRPRRPGEARH